MQNQNNVPHVHKEPESWDLTDDNNAVCPHCGYKNYIETCDFDYDRECQEEECCECRRLYMVSANISVDYTTQKIKEDCDEESQNNLIV